MNKIEKLQAARSKDEQKKAAACAELERLKKIEAHAREHLTMIKGFWLDIFFSPILKLCFIQHIGLARAGQGFAKNEINYRSRKIKKIDEKISKIDESLFIDI